MLRRLHVIQSGGLEVVRIINQDEQVHLNCENNELIIKKLGQIKSDIYKNVENIEMR